MMLIFSIISFSLPPIFNVINFHKLRAFLKGNLFSQEQNDKKKKQKKKNENTKFYNILNAKLHARLVPRSKLN